VQEIEESDKMIPISIQPFLTGISVFQSKFVEKEIFTILNFVGTS
jgi:hypothetical protein